MITENLKMRIVIRCPHCQGRAIARDSIEMSALLREITYMCLNPRCAHTYVAHLEIVRTLSPSGMPNPAIYLPISSRAWAHKREQAES